MDNSPELPPDIEPLTPEEKEAFLTRARARGETLTSEEQYAIFGPPPDAPVPASPDYIDVQEMEAAAIDDLRICELRANFFPELGANSDLPAPSLVRGIIFDFDYSLAHLTCPPEQLLEEGAKNAEAYMRAAGMDLPDNFYTNIIEARRFAEEKSEEEQEEHIADDAMSFLLQFFGYPASKMDPQVLRRAVDIFYAPEMSAWALNPGTCEMLQNLHAAGYKLGILANYNCDRIFQRIIDYLKIRSYFDATLSSASVEYRKPDANFFNLLLERWELLPYEIVVVGDSLIHDIKGGIELGALTVLVEGQTTAQVAHDNAEVVGQIIPDATVDTLTNLPAIIHEWATA